MQDFDFKVPSLKIPKLDPPDHVYAYSDTQFQILKKYIKNFEKGLDPDHEVGLLLTNFGHSITMQVTSVSYEKSVLMVFKGFVDGQPATLIQHVSQLNFLLTALQKDPDRPKRSIGFVTASET